jgi:hypothetical protein
MLIRETAMTPDPAIVADLRRLFLAGATPSRLIRLIASRHASDADWPRYVYSYFWAAFSIVFARIEHQAHNTFLDATDMSRFNEEELHDIVASAKEWLIDSTEDDTLPAWFDSVDVHDDFAVAENINPETHPSLVDSWPLMDEKARQFIRQSMINSQGYYERMRILAKLAERLQCQVINLENRMNTVVSSK